MMNSGSSSLKVTVNGKKYLITGIQKETSCKGLLCAIAKVTSQEEEACIKQYSSTKANENLLERFKGDRKLAGDLTSLNVFNSLGKDAKIIAKETVTVRKELIIDSPSAQVQHSTGSSKHNKNSKKQKSGKETKSKEEKKEKKNKQKSKKNKEIFTTTTTTTFTTRETKVKHKIKHRSVDDSDIEGYRRDSLKRMKQKRRVYDDSDIDIYKNLENIVVDQNKKLRRLQKHSREVKRTAWMKELTRNSQIYYIDDEPSKVSITEPIKVEADKCVYEKDDGNDSGLPSPEYDSSESQENHPIKLKESLLLANDNTKYQITKDEIKQNHLSKENNENVEQLNENNILPNTITARNENKRNSSDSTEECISIFSTKRLSDKETVEQKNVSHGNLNDVDESEISALDEQTQLVANGLPDLENEKDTLQMLTLKTMVSATKEDQLIQNTTVDGDNKSTLLLIQKENYKNAMLDKNKNILKDTEACEREVHKMVAFNEALFKGSTTVSNANSKSKNDKKKVKKSDISDPVLLSPSTLKKHQSVKKVQSVLGKQAADVLRKDVLKNINGDSTSLTETKLTKEKEKYFNKKLKEIRGKSNSKKSSKTSGKESKSDKNEPEYFPKRHQDDKNDNNTQKSTQINELQSQINGSSYNHELQLNDVVMNNEVSKDLSLSLKIEQSKEISNSADISKPESKQIKHVKNSSASISEPVLTADEILKDILEYERNIKNELDQIIHCEEKEEEDEKVEKINKGTMINKTNDLLKIVDKQDNSELKTSSNLSKQTNNIIKRTVKENDNFENTSSSSTLIDSHRIDNDVTESVMVLDEDQEKFDLIEEYLEEKQALDEISEKLSEYNYALSRLQEDIDLYDLEAKEQKTLQDLDVEEQNVCREIENVKSLLKSVADLTAYQRKEMSENIEIMDQIDLEVRTQKANYENLRSGTWRNNSKLAPRSLIKNVKVKRRNSRGENKNSSSFV